MDFESLSYPRVLYRENGDTAIFSSYEAFQPHNDGKWGATMADFGVYTAPSAEQMEAERLKKLTGAP